MDVTRRTTLGIRIQRYVFVVLLLGAVGILAWLSTRYVYQADWTYGNRNSLAGDSVRLLQELDAPVVITAFAREDEALRSQISDLIARYQQHDKDITLTFVNPDADPERVRDLGITLDGELLIAYQKRTERVQELSEQALTNALLRIARQGERWIGFLTGQGERDPQGQANYDLGTFAQELERKGLKVESLNLAETPTIPDNISTLVIASPQVNLLPGVVRLIQNYVEQGGNLLWLTDPDKPGGLQALADDLGIGFLPGVVVDATTQLFGIQNPSFVLVPEYPAHSITRELKVMTIFPKAVALDRAPDSDWDITVILATLDRVWTETSPLEGEIGYDAGTDEHAGPLEIGFALTRTRETSPDSPDAESAREQRVVVIGDGDFLSNAYLGNGGNLELGLDIIHWLTHDDAFIAIQPKAAPDQTLVLDRNAQMAISLGFLMILPLGLLIAGFTIWLRRRKR